MSGKTLITDWGSRGAHLDVLGHLPVIDVDHHRIHEGHRFTTVDIDDVGVGAAAPKYWLFRAPNLPLIHFIYSVHATYSGTVELFRGPTVTDDGTPLLVDNNNQNNSRMATMLAFSNPTVTDDGTLIGGMVIGSDGAATNNKGAIGGERDRKNERILKKNTDYVIKFTPILNDTRVSVRVEHYEQVCGGAT